MTNELDLLRSYMSSAPVPASPDLERSRQRLEVEMAQEMQLTQTSVPSDLARATAWRKGRRHPSVALALALSAIAAAVLVVAVLTLTATGTPSARSGAGHRGTPSWRLVDSTTSPFRALPPGGQTDLQCVTDLVCYSPGASGDELYRTGDGGQSWQATAPIPLPGPATGLRFSFSCPTVEVCAVIGSSPNGASGSALAQFIVTTDGGAHWSVSPIPVPSGLTDPGIGRLSCGDVTHCVVSVGGAGPTPSSPRQGTFLSTADAGRSWRRATSVASAPAAAVWTMTCDANGACLAVSLLGGVPSSYVVGLRSDDWGLTWSAGAPAVSTSAPIVYASCGDATHCMLVPLAGPSNAPYEIATTSDAGRTWQVTGPPARWENMPTAVSCANADDCWIAMSSYDAQSRAGGYSQPAIEVTHDGGTTWSSLALPTAKRPIADVLTLSCPPSGDGCMGIGNLQDHMLPPSGPGSRPHPLSGPLVISNLPVAGQSQ